MKAHVVAVDSVVAVEEVVHANVLHANEVNLIKQQ
jgi:hypothetical protein